MELADCPIFVVSKVNEAYMFFFYIRKWSKKTLDSSSSCLGAMCFDMVIESKCYSVVRERERFSEQRGDGLRAGIGE